MVLIECMRIWPPTSVIEGWVGPLEAAQDFILPVMRIETKAIQPDARVVRISSADQLYYNGPLTLGVVTLATVMAESAGVTPRDVSDVVREELRSQGLHAALSVFESRLAAGGFLEAEADLSLRSEFRKFAITLDPIWLPRDHASNAPQGSCRGALRHRTRRVTSVYLEPLRIAWT